MTAGMDDVMLASVERAVCGAVNAVMEGKADVSPSGIYGGSGNVPVAVAMARHFCFYVMKDKYGIPYKRIARRAGVSVGAVMKKVRKMRGAVFFDTLAGAVCDEVNKRLERGIYE